MEKERIINYWSERSHEFVDLRTEEQNSEMGRKWLSEIEKNLPKGRKLKILDVGTGCGFFSVLLVKGIHPPIEALVLALPTFIDLLQITDSSLAPGLSTSTLLTLSRVCSVLSFLLMIVRGLYGKWLYRRSAAARIRRIRAEFPDPEQRRAVLNAQGGVSFAACIGAFILLMIVGSLCSMLLGPDLNALVGTFI